MNSRPVPTAVSSPLKNRCATASPEAVRREDPQNTACEQAVAHGVTRRSLFQRVARATRPHRGFTLLEVLLSLMLTSLVLVGLGMAVDFHLRVADRGRAHVEEAQLARALLHRIANDLRGAVAYDPINVEELVSAMGSSVGSTGGTGDQTEIPDLESSSSGLTSDLGESIFTYSTPGVYGEADWLQVDVSRLPRLDQYEYMTTPVAGAENSTSSLMLDRVSDVKTIAYYLVTPGEEGSVYLADGTLRRGLVRRELDRAVTNWADEQGRLADMELELEPVAPEVAAMEFSYFDGTEWLDYWDSEEQGGLPMAVEILLAFLPADSNGTELDFSSATDYDEFLTTGNYTFYRLVVHLPAAQLASEESDYEGIGTTEESTSTEL